MDEVMKFPKTAEEFMEQYKVVDTDHVYSNGVEFVPIFRMKQWFEHTAEKTGKWESHVLDGVMGHRPTIISCSNCNQVIAYKTNYCPNCGARMVDNENL